MPATIRHACAACALVLAAVVAAAAQPTVFVVRHAERADQGGAAAGMMVADPDLSAAGHARARSLATVLADVKITAIYTTELKRTRQTAAPLAKALGIAITQVPGKDVPELVKRIGAASGSVLVVGHSNTVPELIRGLGIDEPVTIGEQDFDNLFIVSGAPPTLLRLHYR